MVRLKAMQQQHDKVINSMFQFLDGAIKSKLVDIFKVKDT